jgi:GH3 auxin-responsive promoter
MNEATAKFVERCHLEKRKLRAALADAEALQARLVLEDCVAAHAETVFGREHAFRSIQSLADYRRAVPIRRYEGFASWFERSAAGEPRVLTAEEPALWLKTKTPGRMIPLTPRATLTSRTANLHALYGNFYENHPQAAQDLDACLDPVNARGASTLDLVWVRAPCTEHVKSGTPLVRWQQRPMPACDGDWKPPWFDTPWFDTSQLAEQSERMYVRIRYFASSDLRAITAFYPETLIELASSLETNAARLVEEVRNGTLLGKRWNSQDLALAKKIESRVNAAKGAIRPHDLWPNLSVIMCWKSGPAEALVPRLHALYGQDVKIVPYTTGSTETAVAIPIDNHPSAGILNIRSCFFEFIPASEPIRADSATLLFQELEKGGEYKAILTHVTGLYRYAFGDDVFRVHDFVDGVPRIEYVGRRQSA